MAKAQAKSEAILKVAESLSQQVSNQWSVIAS